MPFIDIKILEGHSEERRRAMAQGIAQVVMDTTGLSEEDIWITFQEISPDKWYTGKQDSKDFAPSKQS